MKTLSFVRRKVILITLPVSVRSIMPKSALVHVMTITSNAMPPSGVKITDTILRLVPCRPLLTNNAQTDNLITNNVLKTVRGLVVNKDMSILVLRDAFMQLQTAARGILLMVNAVPHRPLPDVRPIMKLVVPVLPPVPMPAVTPVINVVMTIVRPERLKTIPVLYLLIPNAAHPVIVVKIVLPAALLIPENMSVLPNAALAMPVTIPAKQVLLPLTVHQPRTEQKSRQPNAEPPVIPAKIIPTARLKTNPAFTDVLLITLAVSVPPAEATRIAMLLLSPALTDVLQKTPAGNVQAARNALTL